MKRNKKIVLMFLIICILFITTGCKDNEKEKLQEKVISELEYVNVKILDMLNLLNNISFENYKLITKEINLGNNTEKEQSQQGTNSKEKSSSSEQSGSGQKQSKSSEQEKGNQDLINTTEMITDSILANNNINIEWDILKPEIELLNESLSIIILDLYSLNVDSDTILNFSTKLNNAMIAIKDENKIVSLSTLADLYSSIPQFLEKIKADKNLIKIRQTQSYVINAYSLSEDMTNLNINTNLQKAIEVYSEVVGDINYTKDKTFKTNKAYVLLNELANSIKLKDKSVFHIKYKNFMETINEIK